MVEPEATQGLNRYSYVLNNPLTFTDPTGQLSFRQVVGLVVGIAFSVWSGQLWAINNLWGSFAAAVGGGFASSVIATGSLKAGLWGAVSAAAFWGIGTAFSKTYAVAKEGSNNMVEVVFRREASGSAVARIAAHAGAGGALADLQGGNFGSGFLSAGVTKWLSPAVSSIGMGDGERSFVDLAAQTVASATIGGTASAITGNGFGSGAQTAAFQHLFNEVVHSADEARRSYGQGTKGKGHHWVPFGSTTGDDLDLSPDARRVFGQAVSGEKLPSSLHNTDHSEYNRAVRTELVRWATQNDVDLSTMTSDEADRFVRHIRSASTSNVTIDRFVTKIHQFNRIAAPLGSAGKFFLRNILVPVGMVDLAEQTISINSPTCVAAPGNPCAR